MPSSPTFQQDRTHALSLSSPETFWLAQAARLDWEVFPTRALQQFTKKLRNGIAHQTWDWFPDGEISTCWNCLDRHVAAGRGEDVAVIWDSPVTGQKEQWTYGRVLLEVELLAGVLRAQGVGRGDVVLIYMPMIPAALFAMLATVRLGAIHAVVFGGFAAASLAQRIEASKPKVVLTASCGIEGSKGALAYKPFIRGALEKSRFKPRKVLVWDRKEQPWGEFEQARGEADWQDLTAKAEREGVKAACVPIKSGEGLYIIYTSGTTGLPKGILRPAGGHAVNLAHSISYLFEIPGPGNTMFCASDIGWVVGHSFIVYAPLLVGATTVLFEGKPVGTPDSSTFWRIIQQHEVNVLFTAPTALRAIKRDDPRNEHLARIGKDGGLRTLRGLFLAGERSEPGIVTLYERLLEKWGAPGARVVDNWWSSESGSPISGIALRPSEGVVEQPDRDERRARTSIPKIKAGAAGKPMPGFDVRAVDDEGKEVPLGSMGNIVLGIPLAPSGFVTLFNDEERFYGGYMKRFGGKWIDTGDAGMIDEEGYVHVMSRSDDIINVAAHRFSTGSIEQAISSHPSIAESCVVSIPDALKGHLPFAFVTLSTSPHPASAVPSPSLYQDVQRLIREQIGAIAALGGMVQGKGMIPKTRSGKTLRRVLKQLVENEVGGKRGDGVEVPATVEDAGVVDVAQERIVEYFEAGGVGGRGKAKL